MTAQAFIKPRNGWETQGDHAPLRITFLLPHAGWFGGIRVVAMHAAELRRRGHRVTVLSQPPWRPRWHQRLRGVMRGDLSTQAQQPNGSFIDLAGVEHRILEKQRPFTNRDVPRSDVLIATWWETAQQLAMLNPDRGARVYFLQGFDAAPNEPAPRVEATWRLPFHKIVVSQWLADIAREQFDDDQVSVAPNAVDTAFFHAPPRQRHEPPTVGLPLSPAHTKGADIAVRAVHRAKAANPMLRIAGYGRPEPRGALALPAGSRYYRHPTQATIRAVYRQCDAWLWPSRREGFGLPILEAMACRTPVIATPAGAAPELIDGNGYLVPHDDPQAMAEAIERLLALPGAQWRAMSNHAHATAQRFSWPEATDQFEAGLHRAMARARRGEIEGMPAQAEVRG